MQKLSENKYKSQGKTQDEIIRIINTVCVIKT